MILRIRTRSGARPADRSETRRSTVDRTHFISSVAKLAPTQRRAPPPKGTQANAPGGWSRMSQDVGQMAELGSRGGRGYTYLAERFLPALRDAGVDEATLESLTVENPRRWLTIADGETAG
jgi:hypothetical protein